MIRISLFMLMLLMVSWISSHAEDDSGTLFGRVNPGRQTGMGLYGGDILAQRAENEVLEEDAKKEEPEKRKSIGEEIDDIKKIINEKIGLSINGFFDVTAANYAHNPNIFDIGDFELDLEHSKVRYFDVEAALVANSDGAEVAVALVDIHPFSRPASLGAKIFNPEDLHFIIGKFDVPFGNDWEILAAPDRETVTAPLTTDFVVDGGYNDIGLQIFAEVSFFNLTLMMIRGQGKGNAYGGRIGLTPLNNPYSLSRNSVFDFEIGVSYLHDVDRGWKTEERNYGLDFYCTIGPVFVRSEYCLRDINLRKANGVPETPREVRDGFHVTGGVDFSEVIDFPFMVFGRYDINRGRNNNPFAVFDISGYLARRVSVGASVSIEDVLIIKFEYNRYLDAYWHLRYQGYSRDSTYGQFVVMF